MSLFKSKAHPGLVMNRYGIVLDGAVVVPDAVAGAVKREAQAAGWRLTPGADAEGVGPTWAEGINAEHRTPNLER